MLAPSIQRLYLARAVVDMRKSYDGLASLVLGQLDRDPMSGEGFVFVGRDRKRLKVLVWDGDGFWLFMKRLAKGRFILPHPALGRDASDVVHLDTASWGALLAAHRNDGAPPIASFPTPMSNFMVASGKVVYKIHPCRHTPALLVAL